jgi:hypothetical protein
LRITAFRSACENSRPVAAATCVLLPWAGRRAGRGLYKKSRSPDTATFLFCLI